MPLWLLFVIFFPRLCLSRLAFIAPERFLRSDSEEYLTLAKNLWSHGVFSQSPAPPWTAETFRVPGYPLFLGFWMALCRLPLSWTIAVHCLFGALSAVLLWFWLKRRTPARAAALATTFFALDPVLLFHTPMILSDVPFMIVMLAATMLTWQGLEDDARQRWGWRGLAWGIASLMRPVSLYFPAIFFLFFFRRKKALWSFLLGAYLVPAGWCLHNQIQSGHFTYSSQGGIDLLRYPAVGVESIRSHRPFGDVKSDLLADIDRRHGAYRNTLDQGQIYEERALPIISRHPLLFSVYLFNGAVRILAGMGAEIPFELLGKPVPVIRYESTISARGTLQLIRAYGALAPFVVAYGVALMALYTAFVWGIVCLRRSGKTAEAQFLLLGAAYFLALSSVLGYYRFRISLMPFLVIGAAFAFPERNPPYRKDVLP